jgi:hypothetical protein
VAQPVLTGDWAKAKWVTASTSHVKKAISKALRIEAEWFFKMVRETLQKGTGMQKLDRKTLYARRYRGGSGSRPLRETNALFRSIKVVGPLSNGGYFVGIRSGTTEAYRGRQWDMVKLGETHEFGKTLTIDTRKMTPEKRRKMMAFIWIMLKEMGVFTPSGRRSKRELFKRHQTAFDAPGIVVIKIPPRSFLQTTFDRYLSEKTAAVQRVNQSVSDSLAKIFEAAPSSSN